MKKYADRGGCYPPRPKVCIILYQHRSQGSLLPAPSLCRAGRREPWEQGRFFISQEIKPISLIALLFIQNNSQFKNKLKHAYVHLDSACLEDKELFRSANILQIPDVVFKLTLQFIVKQVKCSADCSALFFSRPKQFNSSPALLCQRCINLQLCCTFDVIG